MGFILYSIFMHSVYYLWFKAHTNPFNAYTIKRDSIAWRYRIFMRWWFSSQGIDTLKRINFKTKVSTEQQCNDALVYVLWCIAEV